MSLYLKLMAGSPGRRPYLTLLTLLTLYGLLAGCVPARAQTQPQPWPLWEAYSKRFLDDHGRVIDRSANDRTTSEGQAYAMFFALVANDRTRFGRLLSWTEANLAQGDLTAHLPAWNWGRNSAGEWKTIDDNPAADSDLWLAYTLLEAGRLWHEPRYESLGRTLAARIAKEEVTGVPGVGTTVIPAPRGFHPDGERYLLNPSYMPLEVLTYMVHALPQGPWAQVLQSVPKLIRSNLGGGFAMDWLAAGPDGIYPAAPPAEPSAGRRQTQPGGSYDAIRVYLWLGLADARTPGRRELLMSLPGMAACLRGRITPPLEVDQHGTVVRADAPVGFSAAVIPYLAALGAGAERTVQSDRMHALRDPVTGLYGPSAEYYDQNLVLFSTGWSEQRYHFERDGKLHVGWKSAAPTVSRRASGELPTGASGELPTTAHGELAQTLTEVQKRLPSRVKPVTLIRKVVSAGMSDQDQA